MRKKDRDMKKLFCTEFPSLKGLPFRDLASFPILQRLFLYPNIFLSHPNMFIYIFKKNPKKIFFFFFLVAFIAIFVIPGFELAEVATLNNLIPKMRKMLKSTNNSTPYSISQCCIFSRGRRELDPKQFEVTHNAVIYVLLLYWFGCRQELLNVFSLCYFAGFSRTFMLLLPLWKTVMSFSPMKFSVPSTLIDTHFLINWR